jgi:hypothetical protein
VTFAEWVLFVLTVHSAKPEKNEVLNRRNIYILYIVLSYPGVLEQYDSLNKSYLRHSVSGRHIWNPDFLVQYEISSVIKTNFNFQKLFDE